MLVHGSSLERARRPRTEWGAVTADLSALGPGAYAARRPTAHPASSLETTMRPPAKLLSSLPRRGPLQRLAPALAGLAAAGLVLSADPAPAAAQQPAVPRASGDAKGVVGGVFLGGEVVMVTMAAIGVEKAWPYLLFGGLGMVGGGIGGYFVEQEAPAEVPLAMLAGGLIFSIPTVVAVVNATAPKAPKDDKTEVVKSAPGQPAPQPSQPGQPAQPVSPGQPGQPAPAGGPQSKQRLWIPTAALGVQPGRVALGLPAVEVRPLYTARQMQQFGVEQGTEVRVPLVQVPF